MPPAGMGASGLDRSSAAPVVPPAPVSPAFGRAPALSPDTIATLLSELSQADLTRLLEIAEAPLRSADTAQIDELLHAVGESVATRDLSRALELLQKVVTLSPERAETLPGHPALAGIRPALEQLLSQVTAVARLRAEGRLLEAQKTDLTRVTDKEEIKSEIFLCLAEKLIAAGGLPNYIRSEAVSLALLDPARWAPATVAEIAPQPPAVNGWHLSLRLLATLWVSLGLAAIALCWWLGVEYLGAVLTLWIAGTLVLLLVRWFRNRSS